MPSHQTVALKVGRMSRIHIQCIRVNYLEGAFPSEVSTRKIRAKANQNLKDTLFAREPHLKENFLCQRSRFSTR